MLGTTIPGLTAEVMRADLTARLRDAEERQTTVAMRRELHKARVRDRRARRSARIADLPVRPQWRVRRLTHRPGI